MYCHVIMAIRRVTEADLIEEVSVDENPAARDSVTVDVSLHEDANLAEPIVSIDGVPGAHQTFQFKDHGTRTLHVTVNDLHGDERVIDDRLVDVELAEPGEYGELLGIKPVIETKHDPRFGLTVEFGIDNADEFDREEFTYRWDIDGRHTLTTDEPTVRYDFEDDLESGRPFTVFDVELTVDTGQAVASGTTTDGRRGDGGGPADGEAEPDGGMAMTSVGSEQIVNLGNQTVSVWNRTVLSVAEGTVELRVKGEPAVVRDGDYYTVSFDLHNPSEVTVQLSTRQLEILRTNDPKPSSGFLSLARAAPLVQPPLEEPDDVSVSLAPDETVSREFRIAASDLPEDMFGIGLHFDGTAGAKDAKANVYAEKRSRNPLAVPAELDEVVNRIDDTELIQNVGATISGKQPVSDLSIDTGTSGGESGGGGTSSETSGTETSGDPDYTTVVAAMHSTDDDDQDPIAIPDSEDASVGDPCHPSQEAPEDDMVCKRTSEARDVEIPPRVLNARRGDVLLSPSGSSLIGKLLRQVSPTERYSHSGIITEDHFEVRHSTASFGWLRDQMVGDLQDGGDGFDPEALKYLWPGTITQTVGHAYEGEKRTDPNGTERHFDMFRSEIATDENGNPIHPEVLKPDPKLEYRYDGLRKILNKVTDTAENISSHYRLYAYTDATIFSDTAKASSPKWYDGTRPSVCSSFIWGAIQETEDAPNVEASPGDSLSTEDLEQGEPDDIATKGTEDGLYHYTEAERKSAANWLYSYIKNKVKSQQPVGSFITAAAMNTGNQVTNAFAFDYTGERGGTPSYKSEKWQNPGSGEAISPGTMRSYWDAPSKHDGDLQGLYGYTERLIYRPKTTREEKVWRWERDPDHDQEEKASLTVRVVHDGPVGGATVEANQETAVTGSNGEVQFSLAPSTYQLHAQKQTNNGWHLEGDTSVDLSPGESDTVTVRLENPPEMFRRVDLSGKLNMYDDDWFKNVRSKQTINKTFKLGPDNRSEHLEFSETAGNKHEVDGKMKLDFNWQDDGSIHVEFESKMVEANTTKKEKMSKTVDKGETRSFDVGWTINGTAKNNSKGHFDATVRNERAQGR